MSFYDLSAKTNKGETLDFSTLKGKVVLIVNTASKCGFTPSTMGWRRFTKNTRIRV
ncbi:Glutathione peroxidase 2 [Entomophthora muscae]|uniref:Glutathione peroxidase 2 n=1 Tax=Entomophthora muscae TaxID=34485 RepID=A0ACC2SD86_9FUNG|nr:Glutathione peroxidase 2 [Entomophthora muscae]